MVDSNINPFENPLSKFGFEFKKAYTLKEIVFIIQKQGGVLKKVIGRIVPSGFDFTNESLYMDPSLRRVFSNILIEDNEIEDFNYVISNLDNNYEIGEVTITCSPTLIEVVIIDNGPQKEKIAFFTLENYSLEKSDNLF